MNSKKHAKTASLLPLTFEHLGGKIHDESVNDAIREQTEAQGLCVIRQNPGFVLECFKKHFEKNRPQKLTGMDEPTSTVLAWEIQGHSFQRIESSGSADNCQVVIGTQVTYHRGGKRRFDPCQRLLQPAQKPSVGNGFEHPWEKVGDTGLCTKDVYQTRGPEAFEGVKWKFKRFSQQFESTNMPQILLNMDFFERIQRLVKTKSPTNDDKSHKLLTPLKLNMRIVHTPETHDCGMFIVCATRNVFKAGMCTGSISPLNENGDSVEVSHYYTLSINR